MNEPDVFIVEWGTILRDLQRARPDVPKSLVESPVKVAYGEGYAMSNPRSVAIVAAQKFAADFDLPKGKNSTVLPSLVKDRFWDYIATALADAVIIWDREINDNVFDWAQGNNEE